MLLNSTSAVILGLLHDGSATGGEIVAAAERRLVAQGGVTRSQVYRELPQLVRNGLIEATSEFDVAGKHASQAYRITAAGRAAFATWALMPPTADSVRSAAVLRLGFGAHMKAAQRKKIIAVALVEHQLALAEHEQRAKDIRGEGDKFAAGAADFAVAYERAFLDWLRGFPT